MSESLSIPNQPPGSTQNSSRRRGRNANRRAARGSIFTGRIATGLMTAVTTIVVAYIAILPQIRRDPKQGYSVVPQPTPTPPLDANQKKQQIRGSVLTQAKNGPNSLEVYLVPAGLTTTTSSSDGNFNLPALPAGIYTMIIRNAVDGKSGSITMALPEDTRDLKQLQAKIKYKIEELR